MTGLLLNLRGIYNKDLGGAAPVFDPASLFSSGEAGAWYDPSDTSTVWATTTATIQTVAASAGVTATAGNLVAQIDDKSGNGNHATQATVAARPILRQSGGLYYLEFAGLNDFLDCTGITATAGPVTMAAGFLREQQNPSRGEYLFDIQTGRLILAADALNSGDFGVYDGAAWNATTSADDVNYVAVGLMRSSGEFRLNGVSATSFSMTQRAIGGTIRIGTGVSAVSDDNFFTGNLYSLILRAADTTGSDLTNTESYIADKSGVTL